MSLVQQRDPGEDSEVDTAGLINAANCMYIVHVVAVAGISTWTPAR